MKNKYEDRIGQTIRGCLVLECFKKENIRNPYYKVKCKCNNIFTIASTTLCNRDYQDIDSNCGCITRVTTNGGSKKVNPENNIGKTVRNCKILSYIPNLKNIKDRSSGKYNCLCNCGEEFIISHTHLFKKKFKNSRANCGCFREEPREHKREYETVTYHRYYQSKKHTSVGRKKEFTLTEEQFISISKNPCNYCGKVTLLNAYVRAEDGWYNSSSIKKGKIIIKVQENRMSNIDKYTVHCSGLDRVDNTKGYTLENTVASCTRCNVLKRHFTLEEFYRRMEEKYDTNEHARKIIDFKRSKESEQ